MVGKRVRGALYIHRQAVRHLPEGLAEALARAEAIAPREDWNVARLEAGVVGLLLYEDFGSSAFPSLLSAIRIDLRSRQVRRTSYRGSDNPLILHRKELLVASSDHRVERWTATTRLLQARGAFANNHRIGRLREWERRLAEMGMIAVGDEVRAA
jgi:DNA phosphorothioation-associated putative methyltransferase